MTEVNRVEFINKSCAYAKVGFVYCDRCNRKKYTNTVTIPSCAEKCLNPADFGVPACAEFKLYAVVCNECLKADEAFVFNKCVQCTATYKLKEYDNKICLKYKGVNCC